MSAHPITNSFHLHSFGVGNLEEVGRLCLNLDHLSLGQLRPSKSHRIPFSQTKRLHHLEAYEGQKRLSADSLCPPKLEDGLSPHPQ